MRTSDLVVTAEQMPRLNRMLETNTRFSQLACALLLTTTLAQPSSGIAAKASHVVFDEPHPQPNWQLPVIANGSGSLSRDQLTGRVVYLDFWASWCGPCRLSLPALNRLFNEFSREGFSVVAISVDYVDEDALDFLQRFPVDYPVLIDTTGNSGRSFAVAGMPTGYLIDRSGNIREVHMGFRKGDEDILRDRIKLLINEEP